MTTNLSHDARPTETTSQFLRRRRQELGLSATQLARMAGVSRSTVYNYEDGRHTIHQETLEKLQPVLDFTAAEIGHCSPVQPPARQSVNPSTEPIFRKPKTFVLQALPDTVVTREDLQLLLNAEVAFRPLTYELAVKLLYQRLVGRHR